MQFNSSFVWLTLEEIAAPWSGAIKIGPFGSQLKKEELSSEGYKVYGQENVISGDFSAGDRYVDSAKFSQLQSCQLFPGDVVISMMGTIGHCEVFPGNAEIGIMDSHLLRIQPNTEVVIPEFLVKAIKSESIVRRQITQMSHGSIMSGLSSKIVKRLTIPVPPLPEQRRIAEILDAADDAIRQTERVIAKLRQVKAGLLHDLLTRGLDAQGCLRDPAAHPEQFKESPLGRIPREWDHQSLNQISDLQVGFAFKSEWFQEPDGIRLLRGENVGYGVPDWSNTYTLPWDMANDFDEYKLNAGDIIIGMDRSFTQQGFKVSLLEKNDAPALLVQRVGRFIPYNCNSRFLWSLLHSRHYQAALISQEKGMDIPHLSKTEILAPVVLVPPRGEQCRIAAILDVADARICAEEATLAKLRQVKRGLMDDLLTGRVRVL